MANEADDVEDEIVEEPEAETQAVPSFQHIIDENVKRKNDIEATFPAHLRMPEKSTVRFARISRSDNPPFSLCTSSHVTCRG